MEPDDPDGRTIVQFGRIAALKCGRIKGVLAESKNNREL